MEYNLYEVCVSLLKERGIEIRDIAELVLFSQQKYYPDLTVEDAEYNVIRVLNKREVQNAVITGIELDKLTEEKKLSSPLLKILEKDNPLYGIDEIMVFSIVNLYGSIGFTNYGYLDKVKPGILAEIDKKVSGRCNVFLDDLVGAIAAAAASKVAHNYEENRI